MSVAVTTGSTLGVLYLQPSIGRWILGISGPRGGFRALDLDNSVLSFLLLGINTVYKRQNQRRSLHAFNLDDIHVLWRCSLI